MARTPSGTVASIATQFASALNFTAATNATETVLTVAGATLVAGDLVEVTSSWSKISGRIYRIKTATATALTLEGCNTTSLAQFPAGAGTGSVRKIMTWLQVSQKLNLEASGGDAKTVNYTYVETGDEQTIFDGFSATSYMVDLDADAVGSVPYEQLKTLTDSNTVTALRLVAASGAQVLLSCTVAMNENPTMSSGAVMTNKVQFFGRGRSVRYAT